MKLWSVLILLSASFNAFAAKELPRIYSCQIKAYFTKSAEAMPASDWILTPGQAMSADFLGEDFKIKIDTNQELAEDRLVLNAAGAAVSKTAQLESSWIGRQSSGTIACKLHKPQEKFLFRHTVSNTLFYVTPFKGSPQWSWSLSPGASCYLGDDKSLAQYLVNRSAKALREDAMVEVDGLRRRIVGEKVRVLGNGNIQQEAVSYSFPESACRSGSDENSPTNCAWRQRREKSRATEVFSPCL